MNNKECTDLQVVKAVENSGKADPFRVIDLEDLPEVTDFVITVCGYLGKKLNKVDCLKYIGYEFPGQLQGKTWMEVATMCYVAQIKEERKELGELIEYLAIHACGTFGKDPNKIPAPYYEELNPVLDILYEEMGTEYIFNCLDNTMTWKQIFIEIYETVMGVHE